MDIAVADQAPTIVRASLSLLAWVNLILHPQPSADFAVLLRTQLSALMASLEPFSVAGLSLSTPKMHRARDVATVIKLYGGARFVSTDVFEKAHRSLKAIMPRCVIAFFLLI